MPPVNAFAPGSYVKRGFLMKLEVTQRPLGVHKKWLRRFCILTHSKLFVYEHEKSHGYEKCACFLDLSKIVRCQRTASKHGDYFEFSLFEDEKKSSKFFHVKSKRHDSFGATELTEAEDWILGIQQVLTRIHNQLYENSYSLHPINGMASTGNGRAPVRSTPEDQPTIPHQSQHQQIPPHPPAPPSAQQAVYSKTTKRPIYSTTKIRYPQRANQEKKNEMTYSYSSEENESLDGSFGGSAVVNEAYTLHLTPRSVRSSQPQQQQILRPKMTKNNKIPKPNYICEAEAEDLDLEKDFNEIKTLQEDEREHRQSVISDSTTASCITEVRGPSVNIESGVGSKQEEESIAKQHLAPIVKEVTKLRNLCSLIETDFMSTKNDMGNLQENVTALQKVADGVEMKLQKFFNQMKSTERQAAILLNDLRIKSELLDRKINEVDYLISQRKNIARSNSDLAAVTELGSKGTLVEVGYQTFPKQRHRMVQKKGSTSTSRHSVQICQDPSHQEWTARPNSPGSQASKCDKRLSLMGFATSEDQSTV